ncbi:MAG TPA: malto-oligosyltrehalose synthase, partial [Acidimicrobiales bacterium]|nr:malto-oligosyltrehalose synthase [Acidimicrobiales bacterium]
QLSPHLGLDQASALVGYLARLGITHLYLSPVLQAAPGSQHGYDVVDHGRVSAELGGEEGFTCLVGAVRAAGLGLVVDVVPNHMSVACPHNSWWWDVLENGPASVFAPFFDIDWEPPEPRLRHTVLLPVLEDHYGRVLEAGRLKLDRDGGSFVLRYRDRAFPVAPTSVDKLLGAAAESCGSAELESLATAFGRLPPSTATARSSVRERHRDKEVLRARLADLCRREPAVAAAVDAEVEETNGEADALDALISRQSYRLAYWRTARRETNYRRFTDNNGLVAVRVDDPKVFDATHRLLLEWVGAGLVQGLRIDHVDGLRDPEGYLGRLQEATDGAWVVVEKVLQPRERLRPAWPVAGTTGYDFLNQVGGLFVDPDGERVLAHLYAEITGNTSAFAEVVHEKKHLVLRELLASDLDRLTGLLVQVCETHRRHRDHSRHELREALAEVIACFPVYRTYVRADPRAVTDDDVRYVEDATAAAARRRPDLPGDLFHFLRDLLLLEVRGGETPGLPVPVDSAEGELAARFQQVCSATMAKGAEDTAFYCYVPLLSLNEVGGSPARFGVPVPEFHRWCQATQVERPGSVATLSTHDTKRGEDVRARISLLSEVPEAWADAVRRWMAANRRHRPAPGVPGPTAEYVLYQTLVGAWPIATDRATAYMEKATKEAKGPTSWIYPDPAYDDGLRAFVTAVLADDGFRADLTGFVGPLVEPGRVTSLAQTLVKLTAPGVADTYQGTEVWDLSLVDPDNRRPVDFDARARLLADVEGMGPEEAWRRADEGAPKLLVTHRALHLRRRRPELFGPDGAYRPLSAHGAKRHHVVAFSRADRSVTVVPRLVLGLGADWGDTSVALPTGRWRNLLTGEEVGEGEVAAKDLLGRFPVALLEAT